MRPTSVPRAPKSHTGVPRPSKCGDEPDVTRGRRTVPRRPRTRRTVARMPRSSRSHSTQVPAESMTASVPQVAVPPTRKATMGKVPAPPPVGLRRAAARARALVEHPAGAEGRLGQAGRACSPGPRATPAGRRRCRRWAVRRAARPPGPTAPDESTIVGSIADGDPQRPQQGARVPVDRARGRRAPSRRRWWRR